MTVRATIGDPEGMTVELTEERWSHIIERHPELEPFGEAVLRTVQEPDRRMAGRLGNEQWYYLKTDKPSDWLKVVVAYSRERGHVVTAYATGSAP
jgi:hypothetical protein